MENISEITNELYENIRYLVAEGADCFDSGSRMYDALKTDDMSDHRLPEIHLHVHKKFDTDAVWEYIFDKVKDMAKKYNELTGVVYRTWNNNSTESRFLVELRSKDYIEISVDTAYAGTASESWEKYFVYGIYDLLTAKGGILTEKTGILFKYKFAIESGLWVVNWGLVYSIMCKINLDLGLLVKSDFAMNWENFYMLSVEEKQQKILVLGFLYSLIKDCGLHR